MALDHSNSKKYNLDHEKCINLVLKLNELCEKVYSKFGMRDSFKDMVDFENNIDTTNVKDYKGITKINVRFILPILQLIL